MKIRSQLNFKKQDINISKPMLLPSQSALILEELYQEQKRHCWTLVTFWKSYDIMLPYTSQQKQCNVSYLVKKKL